MVGVSAVDYKGLSLKNNSGMAKQGCEGEEDGSTSTKQRAWARPKKAHYGAKQCQEVRLADRRVRV